MIECIFNAYYTPDQQYQSALSMGNLLDPYNAFKTCLTQTEHYKKSVIQHGYTIEQLFYYFKKLLSQGYISRYSIKRLKTTKAVLLLNKPTTTPGLYLLMGSAARPSVRDSRSQAIRKQTQPSTFPHSDLTDEQADLVQAYFSKNIIQRQDKFDEKVERNPTKKYSYNPKKCPHASAVRVFPDGSRYYYDNANFKPRKFGLTSILQMDYITQLYFIQLTIDSTTF
jgi:hypothetical protein